MTKQEFIKRYGNEAYQQYLEQQKERNRKWREKNPDKFKESKRKHYEEHVEEYKERNRKWREKNPEYSRRWREENPDYDRKRYEEHAEEIKERCRKYYEEHAEERKEWHSNTKQGRANTLLSAYRYSDRKYNRGECTLTQSWIIDKIFSSSCIYCGESDWHKLGCDRINNNLPHTEDNVVCSCWDCNNERKTTDFNEFLEKKKG